MKPKQIVKKEIISQLKCTTPNCKGELNLVDIIDSYYWLVGTYARYHCRECNCDAFVSLDYITENYEVIVQYDE